VPQRRPRRSRRYYNGRRPYPCRQSEHEPSRRAWAKTRISSAAAPSPSAGAPTDTLVGGRAWICQARLAPISKESTSTARASRYHCPTGPWAGSQYPESALTQCARRGRRETLAPGQHGFMTLPTVISPVRRKGMSDKSPPPASAATRPWVRGVPPRAQREDLSRPLGRRTKVRAASAISHESGQGHCFDVLARWPSTLVVGTRTDVFQSLFSLLSEH